MLDELRQMTGASKEEHEEKRNLLLKDARNDLVKADWSVRYDALGHDIVIEAYVSVKDKAHSILRVNLLNEHTGIWIPEYLPWVFAATKFEPDQNVRRHAMLLVDSKWTLENKGEEYLALFSGLVKHGDKTSPFAFKKTYKYAVTD